MKPSDFLKVLSWQDKVLCFTLIFFIFFYAFLFSAFHQFPSEYYGGDHYAHFGSALKIYNTWNPFLSSHYYEELQHYPWLTPLLIALVAKISFIDIFTVGIYFPILILLATIIVTYIFGKHYFEDKTWALLLAITWAVQLVPAFHPSEFAKQLMIPLLAMLLILLYQKREITTKQKLIAGIIAGLAALQHVVTFVVVFVLLAFVLILRVLEKHDVRKHVKDILHIGIAGMVCAALFWIPLLMKYGGKTLNDWQLYSSESVLPTKEFVTAMFLDIIHGETFLTTAFTLVLFFFAIAYAMFHRDKKIYVPFALFTAGLIGVIHPYITHSLLGISLGYYRFPIVFVFVRHIILILGLFYLGNYLKQRQKLFFSIFVCCLLVWSAASFHSLITTFKASERYGYAVFDDDIIKGYRALRATIDEKGIVSPDDVTLVAHPDTGFMYSAMTGRNVAISRITHASPFIDHNQRTADMAIILYGTNRTKAAELIEQYKIRYFFSEFGSIQYRFTCLKNWNATEGMDISVAVYWCLQTDPKYKNYLRQNGIETMTAHVRLAIGDIDVPTQKVLVVKPEELKITLKEVFAYENRNGTVIMKLYEIDT